MSKFKVGDLVTLVVCRHGYYPATMNKLAGKIMNVRAIRNEIVYAGIPGDVEWFWNADDLRLVSAAQPEPAPEPTEPAKVQKPLRRGDLVVCNGEIGVVHDFEPDGEDRYWVAALTGDGSCVCWCAEDLTRIGSIRKKVKRLRQQMEGRK